MASNRVTYCWDTSVFLAWLGEESNAPLGDIDLVITEVDSGVASLLVPVTAYTEVLEAKHTDEQMAKFRAFLKRSNVVSADITQVIAEKAGEIRSNGLSLSPPVKLKTPDATFLATAVTYHATVFHTLEKNQLPQLSGTPLVSGLRIEAPKPRSGHRSLLSEGH